MHTTTAAGHQVQGVRELTDSAYVLRFDKGDLRFKTGQYLSVGVRGAGEQREYSVYSAQEDPYLEILVKEVKDGRVSKALKDLEPGDELDVHGPFGFFLLEDSGDQSPVEAGQDLPPYLFISTGTGISPFHSFVKTHPALDYQLIHGVRYREEAYEAEAFRPDCFTLCLSRGEGGDYSGRVTELLAQKKVDPRTQVYLCGNCEMIYEAYDILKGKGVDPRQIHTEVYF
jgi:ferredoxin--NADP+ reductase